MLIAGEKWACEACIRGHRVSNCHHADRPLTHINKKGRPVSQCPHCRGLRKSRSSHVKCECGEKGHNKEQCPQCASGDVKPGHHHCNCNHANLCTCSVKKDVLEPSGETKRTLKRSRASTETEASKPRLSASSSDPLLAAYANKRRKATHRLSHPGQDTAPYKLGHPQTFHGQTLSPASAESSPILPRERSMFLQRPHSMDGQTSISPTSAVSAPYGISRPHSIHGHTSYPPKSLDAFPHMGRDGAHNYFPDHLALNQYPGERLVRSAHGSPVPPAAAKFEQFAALPQLDLAYNVGYNAAPTSSPVADEYGPPPKYATFESYVSPVDEPTSMPTGGGLPVDWSAMDLPLQTGALTPVQSQATSFASFDPTCLSQLGLTGSSLGEVSEAEDYASQTVPSPHVQGTSPYHRAATEPCAIGQYGISGDSFTSIPQGPVMANNLVTMGMEQYMQRPTAAPQVELGDFNMAHKVDTADAYSPQSLTVPDAQSMPRYGGPGSDLGSGGRNEGNNEVVRPTIHPTSDPLWAVSYPEPERHYTPTSHHSGDHESYNQPPNIPSDSESQYRPVSSVPSPVDRHYNPATPVHNEAERHYQSVNSLSPKHDEHYRPVKPEGQYVPVSTVPAESMPHYAPVEALPPEGEDYRDIGTLPQDGRWVG